MSTRTNKLVVNVTGGEVSPYTYSRFDLPIYQKSLQKCENFLVQPQGGFRFRNGTAYVHTTRLNKAAWLIPFQFNDQQAYQIEATPGYFRFYTQNGLVLNALAFTVSSTTQGAVTQFTVTAHGMAAGAEVFIKGYAGNGWDAMAGFYPVTIVDANNFTIPFNSTGLIAPVTTGTVTAVYEITTPYLAPDLQYLQIAQIGNLAYIANQNYEPRKLTRNANANWTLATYVRTTDPFPNGQSSISAATKANPCQITATAHGLSQGEQIFISGVVGMTQLNGNQYLVGTVIDANNFTITDLNQNPIDSTGFTTYVSGGTVAPSVWPRAVAFDPTGRLLFGGTPQNPMTIWASAAPTTSTTRYDVFTGGSLSTDAMSFTLAPIHGLVDNIEWISSTYQSMIIGCYGSIRTLYGATVGQPISSPSNVTSLSINAYGAANAMPVSDSFALFYIQRGGLLLRSADFNYFSQTYTTTDRNLIAEHLTPNGFKQCLITQGQPDFIWVNRYDGRFLGLTYNALENVSGWHRHYLGGFSLNTKNITMPFGKVLSIGRMLRNQTNSLFAQGDQLWFCVERQINGATVRSIEYLTDAPVYPMRQDFIGLNNTGNPANDSISDNNQWLNAMFESQKTMCHLDMSSVYDGSQIGIIANANLTPAATSGNGITVTSSASVFTAAMVGRQIWKQYDINGNGGGRAVIKTYISATQITVDILVNFDNTNVINAGAWYLTATQLTGLTYLNGETVTATGDGAFLGTFVVSNGAINLVAPVSYANVGYSYIGTLISMNLDSGGQTGSAEAKPRNIYKAAFNFYNTSSVTYGTNAYDGQDSLVFRQATDIYDRPIPLFTGIIWQTYLDEWKQEGKQLIVKQPYPLPCIVTSVDAYISTTDG